MRRTQTSVVILACELLGCLVATTSAWAQPRGRVPPAPDDQAGFVAIFDGKSLDNWEGDPRFWRVEDGAIVGESTPEKVVERNTFLIWKGGPVADFELKLEFKLSDTANSGVQYRSAKAPELGPWAMRGYQADMDGLNLYTGMVYEERGRGFLAERGQFARMAGGKVRKLIGSPGDSEALKSFLKPGDWNQLHVIARGTVLIHVINGHVMSLLVDDDAEGRAMDGLLGLQLHAGKPMRIEFRNIFLRKL
ncbi:MAG: DUF1080 domain-containing protein [Bryobacteraceae bacterium]|jgi:hypothetical protein|nr:DUF1080 domain-containing protein [Bryobacteraceae bacterium]